MFCKGNWGSFLLTMYVRLHILGANAEILSVRYKTVLTSISNVSVLRRILWGSSNLNILFMNSADIFFCWKILYVKSFKLRWCIVTDSSLFNNCWKGDFFRLDKLFLMLFREGDWFYYSFPCCDSITLMDNT